MGLSNLQPYVRNGESNIRSEMTEKLDEVVDLLAKELRLKGGTLTPP